MKNECILCGDAVVAHELCETHLKPGITIIRDKFGAYKIPEPPKRRRAQ